MSKTKDLGSQELERQVLEMRQRHFSIQEIIKQTGVKSPQTIKEIFEKSKVACIEAFKKVDRNSACYRDILVNAVRLLRTEYHMNYKQIAQELDESEYVIFDVIRRNSVSQGKHGYIRGSFTREEKRMRNKDMIRLNEAEGKTLAEIGKIYFTSKQNISMIFQEINYKPVSDKEALSAGVGVSSKSVRELELESEVQELKTDLDNTKRTMSMTKYHLNGVILDLRIGYINALITIILSGSYDDEVVSQYKTLRHTLRRTYNALINAGADETNEVTKLTKIMPKLLKVDRVVNAN